MQPDYHQSIQLTAADDDRLQRARAVIRHKPRQKERAQRISLKKCEVKSIFFVLHNQSELYVTDKTLHISYLNKRLYAYRANQNSTNIFVLCNFFIFK